MFRHNNFACGLCISIVALTATMCLYNVSRADELIKGKKPKNINIQPSWSISSNSTRTPARNCGVVQQIFTLVPRLNPSLGFVTAQEIWSTENTNNNNNKKQRRNLDSGAFRPRVKRPTGQPLSPNTGDQQTNKGTNRKFRLKCISFRSQYFSCFVPYCYFKIYCVFFS